MSRIHRQAWEGGVSSSVRRACVREKRRALPTVWSAASGSDGALLRAPPSHRPPAAPRRDRWVRGHAANRYNSSRPAARAVGPRPTPLHPARRGGGGGSAAPRPPRGGGAPAARGGGRGRQTQHHPPKCRGGGEAATNGRSRRRRTARVCGNGCPNGASPPSTVAGEHGRGVPRRRSDREARQRQRDDRQWPWSVGHLPDGRSARGAVDRNHSSGRLQEESGHSRHYVTARNLETRQNRDLMPF